MSQAVLKVMDVTHLNTTTVGTILDLLFKVRIQKNMILLGEAVHRSRSNRPYPFAATGNVVAIDFRVGDLL